MMETIQRELTALAIPFDSEGNRSLILMHTRCFPHVINLSVKAGLKELTALPDYDPDFSFCTDDTPVPIPQALLDNVDYWDALRLDLVAAARKLVTACRASGQRRDTFLATLKEGNAAGGWGDPPEICGWLGCSRMLTRVGRQRS
jgi:hypothetical protein